MRSSTAAGAKLLPQLHDTGDVARGEDPPDVVKVSNKDAAICSTGESQRGQQLVPFSLSVAAGAGDAPTATVSFTNMVEVKGSRTVSVSD